MKSSQYFRETVWLPVRKSQVLGTWEVMPTMSNGCCQLPPAAPGW